MNETQSVGQSWWCKFHQQWHKASKSSEIQVTAQSQEGKCLFEIYFVYSCVPS